MKNIWKHLFSGLIAVSLATGLVWAGPGGGGGGGGPRGGGGGGGGGSRGGAIGPRAGGGGGSSGRAGQGGRGGQAGPGGHGGGQAGPGGHGGGQAGPGGHGGGHGGPGWHGGGPGWRPGPGGFAHYYGPWYHGDWHDHWGHPWWGGPVAWWSVGFVTGAVIWDAPWRWGYWTYYNPYYTEVIVIDNTTTIDYSRPIVVTAAPAAQLGADPSTIDSEVQSYLNASRAAFARGDYDMAMSMINRAIAKRPNDTVLHEFRGLILFATRQYPQAAAAIYAVLSIAPGWDWATLSSFYPDVAVYTSQLRTLEQQRNETPNSPQIRFLLAYHYMSCGHPEAAVAELKEAVRLSPKDQLSAQLLAGLSSGNKAEAPAAPAPNATATPAVASKPVAAADLQGVWTATRGDGDSFSLSLTSDGTYSWQYAQAGRSQQFSGVFTVADNLLILKQNGAPVMIGQVALIDARHFNFKLVGSNASDPGLTFGKK